MDTIRLVKIHNSPFVQLNGMIAEVIFSFRMTKKSMILFTDKIGERECEIENKYLSIINQE